MSQITLHTGPERRRRWSAAEQREIMTAAFEPGAVVVNVARRFAVSTSMIYKWRRAALAPSARHHPPLRGQSPLSRSARSEAAFVPAVVVPDRAVVAAVPVGPAIVIELAGGTRLTIDAQASAALVGTVLRALR